jgi:hypothetical protein
MTEITLKAEGAIAPKYLIPSVKLFLKSLALFILANAFLVGVAYALYATCGWENIPVMGALEVITLCAIGMYVYKNKKRLKTQTAIPSSTQSPSKGETFVFERHFVFENSKERDALARKLELQNGHYFLYTIETENGPMKKLCFKQNDTVIHYPCGEDLDAAQQVCRLYTLHTQHYGV